MSIDVRSIEKRIAVALTELGYDAPVSGMPLADAFDLIANALEEIAKKGLPKTLQSMEGTNAQ